jgi:photosystem II stability/assembly factor-like uncharacterized protein
VGSLYATTIASSADGTKLAAAGSYNLLYLSSDSGASWSSPLVAADSSGDWIAVASSTDGTKLVAADSYGYLYTSTTTGKSWIRRDSAGVRNWNTVASSADGTKLVAAEWNGYIYTSSDSGATWTLRTSAGTASWYAATLSADGTKIAVAPTNYGYIYTSSDSGATWTERTGTGQRSWRSVASNTDGTKLVAVASQSRIYTSTDSGVTWQRASVYKDWSALASSADGTRVFASVYNGYLYNGFYDTNGHFDLAQDITPGTLSTDVRDASNNLVANPSFALSGIIASTSSSQTAIGTLGTASQRLSVDNPAAADGGFSVTINATVPGTGTWSNGTNSYAYNGTASTGLLSIDPSIGTWTARVGTTTALSKGVAASFSGNTPVTLVVASSVLENIWNGYVTGIGLSQSIPAGTPAGSYTLSVTHTVTVL